MTRTGPVLTDDGCRLWVAEAGAGPPLIACHGGPGLWDMFGSLAGSLARRVRVIRWDQRGCGRSERHGPYSLARSVADLRPRWAVDSLERALPSVTRVVLADAGHVPWLEVPDEFGSVLLGYLGRTVAAQPS